MSDLKYKILFVCIHNSARSQMAEAFLKKYGSDYFEVESAGLEPGRLNPNVVDVMKAVGIDISDNGTQSVFDLFRKGRLFNAVVTVCDEARAESCPIFPGRVKRIAWSFTDPSSFDGTKEEILVKTAELRDQIEKKVIEFMNEAKELKFWI
jgi:arsenate reductase (thioredoxin)